MRILEAMFRDFRFAARSLRRTPAFALTATLSLAAGFALATAAVSVVNAYLLQPLPYPAADRLYHVRYAPPGPWEPPGLSGLDWRSLDVVEHAIGSGPESLYLARAGYTTQLNALRVTHGFSEGLGVAVASGRRFEAGDFRPGTEPAALIGHGLWRGHFGADPGIVGRLIRLETDSPTEPIRAFRVIGVLAPGFFYGRDRTESDLLVAHPSAIRVYMVRLREGASAAVAEQRITEAVRRTTAGPLPGDWPGVTLESVRHRWIGGLRPVLVGLAGAVALMLVIVCANVAVLVLLRSLGRRHEVAVRLAVGAGRAALVRMLLCETLLLAGTGAVVGISISAAALRMLGSAIELQLGQPAPAPGGVTVDTTVLLILVVVGLLVIAALTVAPLTSWRAGLAHALHQDAGTAPEGRFGRRLRGVLIASEVAGSLVLLVACGMLLRSFGQIVTADLGFDPDGLIRSRIALRAGDGADAAALRATHERFARHAGDTLGSPLAFSSWPPFVPPPTHTIESEAQATGAGAIAVSGGYFSAFGIRLRAGREFTDEEASGGAAVAIVSETLAARLWPSGDALGRRVREIQPTPQGPVAGPWRTVIGVAQDVRQAYDDDDRSDFYTPHTPQGRFGMFYVRTALPLPLVLDRLREAAAEAGAAAVINAPRPASADDRTRAAMQFFAILSTTFSGTAALLAMLGIYGVTAYAVQQRQRELAIRVALGATPRAVFRLFLGDGALLLGSGALTGLAGAALLAPVLRSYVIGVTSFEFSTWAPACAVLLAAGIAALLAAVHHAAVRDVAAALTRRA